MAVRFSIPGKQQMGVLVAIASCVVVSACGGGGGGASGEVGISPTYVMPVGSTTLTPQAVVASQPAVTTTPVAATPVLTDTIVAAAPRTPVTTTNTASQAGNGAAWGTFLKLFAADSPWNSRPIEPVLGDAQIPTSTFFPAIQEGIYSTAAYQGRPTDPTVSVRSIPGSRGMWNADAEQYQDSVQIPHWPGDTLPASGGDGHADIVDTESGVVHSFWQLKRVDGQWQAAQYAWSRLNGRGWGDPAHYMQGARSAGVPTSGGLIRKHEVNDGDTMYRHALAMSLTYNGLSPSPTYVFPATASDNTAATTNTGSIPMGSLLMLPDNFDVSSIANPHVRKVAETLKRYGAYVVDRNRGTPFVIYVEIGSGFSLHNAQGKWDDAVGRDLHRIREQLRPVASAVAWIDGNGQRFKPTQRLNLLSMRGPWQVVSGSQPGQYDTWRQAMVFDARDEATTMVNTWTNVFSHLSWAAPQAGQAYKLTARTTGGATLRLSLRSCDKAEAPFDSQELRDGQSVTLTWPTKVCSSRLLATSGTKGTSTVSGELLSARPD